MKRISVKAIGLIILVVLSSITVLGLFSFKSEQKIKIGFLVHDLVSDRWRLELENFSKKITELGGEVITQNALGDVQTQISQGKAMIDQGVKVIAIVAQNGKALSELVDYANKSGTIIIAYDRMIMNCDLPYYVSFNSVKVGELMAEYMLNLKPKGNYVILNGPATDNNARLVKLGVMSKLKDPIEKGDITVLMDKEMDSWYSLSALMAMEDFLMENKKPIDVVIAANDNFASGALDAVKVSRFKIPFFTGQDATLDGCKNILQGLQTITIYKSKKLAEETAALAIKLAKGEKVNVTTTLNNGKIDVPSILFDPVVIDKDNLKKILIPDRFQESDFK